MKKRHIFGGLATAALIGAGGIAYVAMPTVHDGTMGEAPELGRSGDQSIGTMRMNFALTGRTRISGMGAVTGSIEPYDRTVQVRLWYPGTPADGAKRASYPHTLTPTGQDAVPISSTGIAYDTVTPDASGDTYPLVLMSHGFNGWDTQFSNLAEHIASRGYVVASIDHGDPPIEGVTDFLLSFLNVLVDRSQDQRQVLAAILARAKAGNDPVMRMIDPETVALVGYSMGGYGALASAGAPYEFSADPMSNLPDAAQQQVKDATSDAVPLDALVLFAPWGSQPDSRVWSANSLSRITAPTLIVAGDEDDIVNFDEGISWLFANLTGAERHLLVYREARHNIVGNAFTLPDGASFTAAEYLNEPVWRSDRLNAINQHFVTAFLDLHLKGDEAKRAFLQLPTTNANDSRWDIAFGEQLNGTLAGADQPDHWRGFQRRWALGLEFHSAEKGKTGALKR